MRVSFGVIGMETHMPDDIEKINEIFRQNDEQAKKAAENKTENETEKSKTARVNNVDKLLIDKQKGRQKVRNYTGDKPTERDYHPVRQSHEYRSGCLGGLMYFVFIACASIVLACFMWMAASDVLALNKADFSAVIDLPSDSFSIETVDVTDDDGNVTGTKNVRLADIDFVTTALKDAGLIEYPWLFSAFCKVSHADEKITPGSYELKSSFDYRALIQNMRAGSASTVTIKVTIPEGFTMQQIFRRLEENEVCSFDELMDAAANSTFNYKFLEGMETGDPTRLEGFLFPDTYEFYVGMQASSAINKFLETFYYKQTADMLKQAADRNLSMRQVVNIASLIEKEAANDVERRLIASVIYNRIDAGMTLGLDASILYVHQDHQGAPSAEMLAEDSPYNTHLYTGLPPTPICNPGMASIRAVLDPETTGYYYYALDASTGQHQFFTNIADFNSFVATQNYG